MVAMGTSFMGQLVLLTSIFNMVIKSHNLRTVSDKKNRTSTPYTA